MKVLALDTATEACSVALWIDGVVHVDAIELARGHAQRILPMVDALLAAQSVVLAGLDAIAVGRGPGGFTGVRLAVSVAQATLDRDAAATHVLVCNDARMKEVYAGFYRRGAAGLAVPDGPERVAHPDSVAIAAPGDAATRRVVGAGRGFRAYPQLASRLRGALAGIDDAILPDAGAIAVLAAAALRAGEAVAPEMLQPVYLRDDVAVPAVTVLQ